MTADSQDPRTVQAVRKWLGTRPLDALFIDGDHSFEGASTDYRMYAPLVRAGGMVAFHDIVSDSKTRTGRVTSAYAGDVPRLWASLKETRPDAIELVDDSGQDGYGIGVLRAL
jgi:predicted O-methyltransferase YrrM